MYDSAKNHSKLVCETESLNQVYEAVQFVPPEDSISPQQQVLSSVNKVSYCDIQYKENRPW